MKRYQLSTVWLLAAALTGQAEAQPPSPPRSVAVSYSDLDLRTPAGRSALQARLDSAARAVCRTGSSAGVQAMFGRQQCLRATAAAVRRQTNLAVALAYQGPLHDAVLAAR